MSSKQKEKIIIIGTGKHAKVVTDILEDMNKYKIVGFISEENHVNNEFLEKLHFSRKTVYATILALLL